MEGINIGRKKRVAVILVIVADHVKDWRCAVGFQCIQIMQEELPCKLSLFA